MSEPSSATKPKRGRPRKTRKNELVDEFASGSEPLDSRDAPSVSVQEDVLVFKVDPNQIVEPEVHACKKSCSTQKRLRLESQPHEHDDIAQVIEPDSDNEAQGTQRATPSMSQRVVNAAQTAKDAVQDTLTSAVEQGTDRLPFNWPALLGLLLLTLLAGYALSTLLRPHYQSDDLSYFSRSVDQANNKYKQLGDYVTKTENRLIDTERRYTYLS